MKALIVPIRRVLIASLLLGSSLSRGATERGFLPKATLQDGKDATGCSRVDDDQGFPMGFQNGGCRENVSGGCYDCTYSNHFGFTRCLESGDGESFFCWDVQVY